MADVKEQIFSFVDKCEELKSCKFIMATTKIKDILKCIVNCPELYRLFEAVTKDFDYPEVKSQCLVTYDDGVLPQNFVVLPKTLGQRLAFIFCLLVEFDKGAINFNDFLRRYFPEDGSYFASYRAFCDLVIKSLQDCVLQVFKEQLAEYDNYEPNVQTAELISALDLAIAQEIEFVANYALGQADKENGIKILTALAGAVKEKKEELIDALICGYNYFALHFGCVSDGITELIQLLEAYEKNL
ncbi:MAG: hypothetical protein K2L42_06085 [Clostridia bacterium]|nr:hypothetical protein [Clostridia bacterium]